jgi:hypothetical protein
MIAYDPRLDRLVAAAGLDHGGHELVIGQRLVDEAFPAAVDGDDAGLAAIDEMRKRDLGAVGLGHERHGRPGRRVVHVLGEVSACGRNDASTIAGVGCGRQMGMILSGCAMAVEPPGHLVVRLENTRAELHRHLARLRVVREQIRAIDQGRLRKLAAAPGGEKGPHAMLRLTRVLGVGVETADMLVH